MQRIFVKKSDRGELQGFASRHLGPNPEEAREMLEAVEADSLDTLVREAIPAGILASEKLDIGLAMGEAEYLAHARELAARNKLCKTYIGVGYHPTHTPSPILRNIFENPGWYTQYTPYQAEIAQGRLEALLNFQTMVSDLTGMPVANASLLDEPTAAAEAVSMCYGQYHKKNRKSDANTVLVSDRCLPQTIDVLRTRASAVGIEVKVEAVADFVIDPSVFAAVVQYPDVKGEVSDFAEVAERLHEANAYLIASADLLSLALLPAPASWGANVVVGNSQRFGVPMGYGGPHAAYFACDESFLRLIPGRIIGVSTDRLGKPAMRMALQTREQHIRRDKATSNICTAQALLAIMAGMYAVYHGPVGIREIAERIHELTFRLAFAFEQMGIEIENRRYFDTLTLKLDSETAARVQELAVQRSINLYYPDANRVSISLHELTTDADAQELLELFMEATGAMGAALAFESFTDAATSPLENGFEREIDYLSHPVFNHYHSETALMRYIKRLENKDLSLTHAMIPLGSCTMKLNAATQLMPLSWPEFNGIHPFAPVDQAEGYHAMIEVLRNDLCKITGFAGMSFQPNSGAQGEYTGLMVIRAYHESRGEEHRNIALIPDSAHGTNPASAVMAGMKVVVVKTAENGNIDLEDLYDKALENARNLSCLMVTYPSTFGVFEPEIRQICKTIHDFGGQVYMDGANMNAQVGLTSPGMIGADVCHLNLHKTFAIPHGGGGPGMGPIGVAEHLVPFLPKHVFMPQVGGEQGISAVAGAPYGSALILLISYAYLKLLGSNGARAATLYAVLNANYLKRHLDDAYPVLYANRNGRVAHEFIVDLRPFKELGIETDDVAKRLIDYGFHAPTMSWPVAGTIMIEPTESEPKAELDRFIAAMRAIREEIREIERGEADQQDNVLKSAPHPVSELTANDWDHPYSREKAAWPARQHADHKFWPSVARVNNAFGDRNVVCTCPPIEEYQQ